MVRWYLTNAGYRVKTASTIAESLKLMEAGQYNLYLLGDGCEDGATVALCRRIRSLYSHTPILFCSAWAFPVDRERGISAGAQGYLTKPVDWDDLKRTIVQLIDKTPVASDGKSPALRPPHQGRVRPPLSAPKLDGFLQSAPWRQMIAEAPGDRREQSLIQEERRDPIVLFNRDASAEFRVITPSGLKIRN